MSPAVARLRDRVKGAFLEKTGNKLSFLPFFALAAAEALRAYPIVNSTVDGDSIVYPATENMSIAVDTERGLLTPGHPRRRRPRHRRARRARSPTSPSARATTS